MTRTLTQPAPDTVIEWTDPPEGYEVVWEDDDRCRVATDEETAERKCRRPGCQRAPVMALKRTNGWWLYCDWHMYGRRIEDGVVKHRILREISPA